MNKRYFNYLLQNNKRMFLILTFIGFIVFPFNSFLFGFYTFYQLYAYTVILTVAVFILPVVNYKFLYKSNSVDVYFNLPLTRKQLFTHTYVLSVIELVGPYLLNVVIGMLMVRRFELLPTAVFIVLITSVGLVALLSINILITVKSNSLIDALICSGVYSVIGGILFYAFMFFLSRYVYARELFDFAEYAKYLIFLMSGFNYTFDYSFLGIEFANIDYIYLIYQVAIIGLTYIYALYSFIHRNVEDAGQVSNSRRLYHTLIPIGTLSIMLVATYEFGLGDEMKIFGLAILFIIYLIANFIHHRDLKFRTKYIVIYLSLLLLVNVLGVVIKSTRGFYLSYMMPKNYDHLTVNYNFHFNDGYIRIEDPYKTPSRYDYDVTVKDRKLVNELQKLMLKETDTYYDLKKYNDDNFYFNGRLKVVYRDSDGNELHTFNYAAYSDYKLKMLALFIDYDYKVYWQKYTDSGENKEVLLTKDMLKSLR